MSDVRNPQQFGKPQVGDRVVFQQMRGPGEEPEELDENAMRGTVLRVIDPGKYSSAGVRNARVRWDSGSESKHGLGMLRVVERPDD